MKINFSTLYILEVFYQSSKEDPNYRYSNRIKKNYKVSSFITRKEFLTLIKFISKKLKLSKIHKFLSRKLLLKYIKFESLGRSNSKFFEKYPSLYFESRERIHDMIRYDQMRA